MKLAKAKEKEKIDLFQFEKKLLATGKKLICGMDEVGRGPLAGPVVVAAVIMPLEKEKIIEGIFDSKKLTEKKREELFEKIKQVAVDIQVEFVDHSKIDQINILNATKLAMTNAVLRLRTKPEVVLVDAVDGLQVGCDCKPIIHGDELSYSIGAASIVAKVTRDRFMVDLAAKYPEYKFESNKGYGSKAHIDALFEHGPCEIHRKTFLKFLGEGK